MATGMIKRLSLTSGNPMSSSSVEVQPYLKVYTGGEFVSLVLCILPLEHCDG